MGAESWSRCRSFIRTAAEGDVDVDVALGGLNYQIERHLFPSMPRPNLRHSQAIVRDFCHQHGIAYYQTTLWAPTPRRWNTSTRSEGRYTSARPADRAVSDTGTECC